MNVHFKLIARKNNLLTREYFLLEISCNAYCTVSFVTMSFKSRIFSFNLYSAVTICFMADIVRLINRHETDDFTAAEYPKVQISSSAA